MAVLIETRKEYDELLSDAERYRWIRKNAFLRGELSGLEPEGLDKAIDERRSREGIDS